MKNTRKSNKELRIVIDTRGFKIGAHLFSQVVFFLILIFNTLFYRLRVDGRRHLRLEKAFIISNHSLYLDPAVVAQTVYPRFAHFTAMEETFHVPVLGPMIRLLSAFPIPDKNPMKRLIRPMEAALNNLGLVHFFPEGKLHPKSIEIHEFKEGAFFFAFYFNIPVVPLTIVPKQKGLLPPKVRAYVGKPVYPDQFRSAGSIRQAMSAMSAELRRRMQQTMDDCLGSN